MRDGLAQRHFSSEELVRAHFAAIHRHNPSLNAYTQLYEESAINRSQANPNAFPISIKDSLDIAGHPTVCGAKFRRDIKAASNALCVDRLEAEGAIVLGKTNTPEFLMNWETYNDVYGRTNNPWHADFTPGGSSGGEASAIAAHLSPGGIGSDGGGSIRLPAAACGICGLKPTPGRIPATGHFPRIGQPGGLLGVIGPMARNICDLRLLYKITQGHDDSDPFSTPVERPATPLNPLIGLVQIEPNNHLASLLPIPAEPFPHFPWDRVFETWRFFFLRLNAHFIGFPTPHTAPYLKEAPPTAEDILINLAARDTLRTKLLAHMDRYPYLLAPIAKVPTWRHNAFPGPESIAPLTYANLLGLPAVTIPVSVENGLPTAIQLIAKPWHEEDLMDLAEAIEHRREPFPSATLEAKS
jgi:amidase